MRKLTSLLVLCTAASQVSAKDLGDYANDAKDYALAPLHWDTRDWSLAGLALTATAAAYSVDDSVRSRIGSPSTTPLGDPHSTRDFLPMAATVVGTFTIGWFSNDPKIVNTGKDMVEALALGTASSFVLKQAIGRERPDSTRDKSAWRNGGDSFPSGHTTAAFAVAQVLADSFPADAWGWRTAAYAMGAATAYARIHGNMHWFSDTVAGAALGMATGRFVSNRSANGGRGQSARLLMQPMQGGLLLSYTVDPYELFAK